MTLRPQDRLGSVVSLLFIAGVAVMAFLAGAWIAWQDGPLFRRNLRTAFIGLEALAEKYFPPESKQDDSALPKSKARDRAPRGVGRHDPAKASRGLTLLAIGQSAHLVDLQGRTRHVWQLDYGKISDGRAVLRDYAPGKTRGVYWRPARLLAGGDLLVVIDKVGTTPEGLALMRLDRDSRPLWVFHGPVHHDFDIAPDGRVLALSQSIRAQPPQGLSELSGPLLDEHVIVLSPKGELLRSVSIVDAFANSEYRAIAKRTLRSDTVKTGDYLHSNNLDYVTAETASRFPFAREGEVMISLRNLSTIGILDLERPAVTWALRGPWWQQHDPDFLPNGNLLIFDNQGDWRQGGRSRVIEVDPATGGVLWQFPPPNGERLWTTHRGEQQLLPNGNVLLNEFEQGRVLEVTRGGEVVWEYRTALEMPNKRGRFYRIMYAERYPEEVARFPFNEGRAGAD